MSSLKKQFRGYNCKEVDILLSDKDRLIADLQAQVTQLDSEKKTLEEQNSVLEHRVNVSEKTNEEIARLALKEATTLIEKAKRNANMILSESLEYVRGLSGEMNDFKRQAIDFRSSVAKMSQDILDTIDNSEVYNLIEQTEETED